MATVNPERFRPSIEREVRARTGLPLTLSGPLRWNLWPLLSIDTGAGALRSPTDSAQILEWRNLQVSASLLSLIRGEWVIGTLGVDGLQVHLRRDKEGHGNWEALLAGWDARGGTSEPQSTTDATQTADSFSVHLGSLQLGDAAIEYRDETSGQRWALRALNLHTGVDIAQGGSLISIRSLALGSTVLAPILRNDGVAFALSLRDFQLDTQKRVLSVAGYDIALASARAEGAIVPGAAASGGALAGPTAANSAQGSMHGGGYTVGGPVRFAVRDLRQWLGELGVAVPVTHDPKALGALTLAANWRFDADGAQLSGLAMKLDDTLLTGSAAAQFGERTHVSFALKADEMLLDRYRTPSDPQGEPFELPVAMLKSLPVDGVLQIDNAAYAGNRLRGITVKVVDDEHASSVGEAQ